ncbi:MAG: TfoX/Sxy family protein [bacterium]|nr:TfoX/Sxy family protein [bacterium]
MRDGGFKDFILEQLRDVDGVRARGMFGGFGLYSGSTFFGILTREGGVYFKTDEKSKERFLAVGMGLFKPSPKQTLKNYYEVPPDILENTDELTLWAREAVALTKEKK